MIHGVLQSEKRDEGRGRKERIVLRFTLIYLTKLEDTSGNSQRGASPQQRGR